MTRRSDWFKHPINVPPQMLTLPDLARLLEQLGCPSEKSAEMAAQLDKRAGQLAARDGRPHDQALAHLIGLMKQGWAAQGKGH